MVEELKSLPRLTDSCWPVWGRLWNGNVSLVLFLVPEYDANAGHNFLSFLSFFTLPHITKSPPPIKLLAPLSLVSSLSNILTFLKHYSYLKASRYT